MELARASEYDFLFSALDRFEQERAKLAGQTCPKCDGSGEGEVMGSSVSPFSGVRGLDPQEVCAGPCDLCDGKGVL